MRNYFLFFALILLGCTSNDDVGFGDPGTGLPPVAHVPEITELVLLPNTVPLMGGNGSVAVTAEISFRDGGSDLQTLWVRMPDGTTFIFDEPIFTETGAFSQNLTMSTLTDGVFMLEFWLVDQAGHSSSERTALFSVSDWTNQLSGLPYTLNDVIWDGTAFIAVGDGGAVLTSIDGIDWTERESGADADLYAVAAHGSDIFAVGEYIVLQSTDHGDTWITKYEPVEVSLHAVVVNSSQVVAGGSMGFFGPSSTGYFGPIILVSEDRGDTWQVIDSWPDSTILFTDFVGRDGLFVAAASDWPFSDGGWVFVSSDGTQWNDVFRDPGSGFRTVVDDGSRFTIAGNYGAVIASIDGLNWTETRTPLLGPDYLSGAWNGTKLVLAGGHTCVPGGVYPGVCSVQWGELPRGISSTDGGVTWDLFNIDGEFRSVGMAYGNGRFVSVGRSEPGSGESAIYTAD
ncbi:MAG: hypothetical protein OEM99_08450 [Gammaproteobacteria bacterium]|nr:hypothetical protein [Gammaproteobacteria bacterium]